MKIVGNFTNPPWNVSIPCRLDAAYGMYFHELTLKDGASVEFKFQSDHNYPCVSSLYEIKHDDPNDAVGYNVIDSE